MSAMVSESATAPLEVRVSHVDDIPLGLGRAFQIGNTEIAVFRSRAGSIHAVENRCPHRGGPLAEGMLAGNRVVCPYHSFRYELQTGNCDQAGACAAEVFPARVSDGWILLTLPGHLHE